MNENKLCKCGCGEKVSSNKNIFLNGHQCRGIKLSQDHKLKISLNHKGMIGRKHSEESKLKNSKSHLGKKHSKETKEKLSLYRIKFLSEHPEFHPNKLVSNNKTKMTYPEKLVFDYLTINNYPFFHNVHVDRFWVDFIIAPNTIIEIDGPRWHSSPNQIKYDRNRDSIIENYGFVVLRISSNNVIINLKNILKEIQI